MNGGYRCSILKWIWILVTAGLVTKEIDAVFTYDKSHCVPGLHVVNRSLALSAPESFGVRFIITASANNAKLVNQDVGSNQQDALGSFVLQLNRTWAPIGVDRFYQLIVDNYYDCAAFFRVVPGRWILSR
jgi:Cyclophilin type peptidyl-prolyl cis-trans isomerase/CLD